MDKCMNTKMHEYKYCSSQGGACEGHVREGATPPGEGSSSRETAADGGGEEQGAF